MIKSKTVTIRHIPKSVGNSVDSDYFTLHGTRWMIDLCVRKKGYLGVFLHLQDDRPINVKFGFEILNGSELLCIKRNHGGCFKHNGHGRGWSKLIPLNKVQDDIVITVNIEKMPTEIEQLRTRIDELEDLIETRVMPFVNYQESKQNVQNK